MKKFLAYSLILASAFVAVPEAQADLLYFLVDSFNAAGDTKTYNFDYALVGVAMKDDDGEWTTEWGGASGDEKVYLKVKMENGDWGDYVDSTPSGYYTVAGPAWADVSDYADNSTGYAFYIETYKNDSDDPIWGFDETTAQSYKQLSDAKHIYTDSTSLQTITPWSIPEPNTALLLLFGLAGLALRRKHRVGVEG